ncbi:hypothetical protein [Stenotrophomonas nitritireducens]|uniref:hypothetical protein n=1 Tax=Stenotrophomonas nitritireducens TaxID=83617 RepID=UPI002352946D|nr:hypothetical protein [Stenotrophomonas nitritireducens]
MSMISSMTGSLPGAPGDGMKLGRQFLPPRSQVIYAYTHRLLNETATNANSFAMQVAENYFALVAPHMRDKKAVPFRLGEGDDLADALKANGQALRRYMDGTVKTLPADLEDAWVLSLPEPYRSDCERDLAARRGLLPIRLAHIAADADTAGIGSLMADFGQLVTALTPAIADGVIDERDRPHARKIVDACQDVVIAAVTVERRFVALLGDQR